MKALLAGFAIVLGAVAAHAQPVADEVAFVELTTGKDEYFVHEPVKLRLRFGFAPGVVEKRLIQLSRQQLAVPAQVTAPILDHIAPSVAPATAAGSGASFALNGRRATARPLTGREFDEQRWRAFEWVGTIVPTGPGELRIAGVAMRFSYADGFAEDFLGDRRPTGRRDLQVTATPRTLTIRALPAIGRPASFTGAVGRFTISARAAPREMAVGESFRLTVVVEGEGNLADVPPPRLDELADFHVLGQLEEHRPGQHRLEIDLSPLRAAITAVPPIHWSYFDPAPPASYHEIATLAIPIDVDGAAGVPAGPITDPTRPPRAGVDDIFGLMAVPSPVGSRRITIGVLLAGVVAPWLLAIAWIVGRHSFRRRAAAPTSIGLAARECRDQLANGADASRAVAEFLATALDCPAAAVIDPSLDARLESAGVSPELTRDTLCLLDELLAARFGGAVLDRSHVAAEDLVDRLATALASGGPE